MKNSGKNLALENLENLAPSVLPLEQESYLPYIKKVIKEILKTIDPFHF